MRRALPHVIVLVALVTAACGGDEGAATTSQSTTTSTEATTSSLATTTTSAPPTTTTHAQTTTTVRQSTTTTLAGVPIDIGPAEGDVLMVIGVGFDDVLNLRAAPGADQPILAEIPPTFTGLVALGSTRELTRSLWIRVDYETTVGWVNLGYVGYEGVVDDLTSAAVEELGEIPTRASMTALGELISGVFASEEPESTIVQVTAVSSGDLHEVTYDVVGLGDDAVRGVRLHLFAEETSDGFVLKTVEVTSICGRGVDGDGLCV